MYCDCKFPWLKDSLGGPTQPERTIIMMMQRSYASNKHHMCAQRVRKAKGLNFMFLSYGRAHQFLQRLTARWSWWEMAALWHAKGLGLLPSKAVFQFWKLRSHLQVFPSERGCLLLVLPPEASPWVGCHKLSKAWRHRRKQKWRSLSLPAKCKNPVRNWVRWAQQRHSTANHFVFPFRTSLCFPWCGNYQCALQLLPLQVTEKPNILQLLCVTYLSPIQVTCPCCNPLCGNFPGKSEEQVRPWSNWTPTDTQLQQTPVPPKPPITNHGHRQVNNRHISSANLMYNKLGVEVFLLTFSHTFF